MCTRFRLSIGNHTGETTDIEVAKYSPENHPSGGISLKVCSQLLLMKFGCCVSLSLCTAEMSSLWSNIRLRTLPNYTK